jgi:hypothetical protein
MSVPGVQKMPPSVSEYARTQGLNAALINAVLNPVLAWVSNRDMEFMTLSGSRSIVVDTAITSVVVSLLVALFVTWGVRRELKAGQLTATEEFYRKGRLLSCLPSQAWALGLMLGFGIAFVLILLMLALFRSIGISGFSFATFALFKAAYTGLLAFVVARWVIFRQLLLSRPTRFGTMDK